MLPPQTQQNKQIALKMGKEALAKFQDEYGRPPDPYDTDDTYGDVGTIATMWQDAWRKLTASGIPDEDYGQCNKAWYDQIFPPKRTRNVARSPHKLSSI